MGIIPGIEELAAQRRLDKVEKPQFLTKEQRAAQAIERRKLEIAEQRARQQREREELARAQAAGAEAMAAVPEAARAHEERSRDSRRSHLASSPPPPARRANGRAVVEVTTTTTTTQRPSLSRRRSRSPPPPPPPPPSTHAPARSQQHTSGGRRHSPSPPPPPPPPPDAAKAQANSGATIEEALDAGLLARELSANRKRYLGEDPALRNANKKKQVLHAASTLPSSKRFVFDWDAAEDTAKDDYNPIYRKRHEPALYGRGTMAGMAESYGGAFWAQRRGETPGGARPKGFDERTWRDKKLHEMTERDWRIFKEDYSIATRGGRIPNPIRDWEEERLIPMELLSVILEVGYATPTPIQRQAIPIGLQNRDLIGIAETGSGKTAAFLIPMISFILGLPPLTARNRSSGPYAIIMAPSRELAVQIEAEARKFAAALSLTCVSIIGGHTLEEQSVILRNGAHIIIATPGRLRDCLERRMLVLTQCTYVVMDEADRMIDMGFETDMNFILDSLPVSNTKPDSEEAELGESALEVAARESGGMKYRQTTMFSATMPAAVERLARTYLRRPATIMIGSVGQAGDNVAQVVEYITSEEKKKIRLLELLAEAKYAPPIIIFVNKRFACDAVAKIVEQADYKCAVLHGSKSQDQREAALAQIKGGQRDVLVATDVAGRGIDVKDVSLVINFDMARTIEDYTHRIGRTGRAGKSGTAITFLAPTDQEVFFDLYKLLKRSPHASIPSELSRSDAARNKLSAVVPNSTQGII